MENAARSDSIGNEVCVSPSSLATRKQKVAIDRLEVCRDAILGIDTAEKESWKRIIEELIEGGFEISDLETELAASGNTIYKWRSGAAAPREMTRRLLRKAIVDMVEERLEAEQKRLTVEQKYA